jgi:NO-binding membrane sensor protein with MHYT domain/two-component sensor histidine kinase
VIGTYDSALVVLSVVVAVVASYVALDLASRIAASRGRKAEGLWLAAGAISMGTGIWSMHFIGMLACQLPIPMSFDIPITIASLLAAVVASACAFYVVLRGTLGMIRLLRGGALLGIGIITMHYTGMAAMHIEPRLHYQPLLVGVSCLLAIAGAVVACWSAFALRFESIWSAVWRKTGSALVMGAAIVGMHYVGMAAAVIAPGATNPATGPGFSAPWVATTVGLLSLSFQAALLLVATFDKYHADRLEVRVAARTAELAATNEALVNEIAARKVAEERIEQSEAVLRQLIEDRERMSRDLHDGIVQEIYAVGLGLEEARRQVGIDDETIKARLAAGIASLNGIIREVRKHVSGQSTPRMSGTQLREALEELIRVLHGAHPLWITLDVDSGALPLLAPDASGHVLNIVREAVSNSLRHSGGRMGRVSLRRHGDGVRVIVEDDGVGFDVHHALESGQGLRNIIIRARELGAQAELDSTPGRGTRIVIDIPSGAPGRS